MKYSRGFAVLARYWVMLVGVTILTGCANMYVDGTTREVSVSQYRKPDPVEPVQVLFEFQTEGVANVQGTEFLKTQVVDQVKESGLFSEVAEGPVAGGALLSITLNNVPITDDVFSKGFVTGLTFGLVGSQASDGYVCTARYVESAGTQAIVKQARHAIHTTVGASAAPANAIKANDAEEAVTTMTRQIVSNVLNDLSHDATFK
jgi:hypothetical protein